MSHDGLSHVLIHGQFLKCVIRIQVTSKLPVVIYSVGVREGLCNAYFIAVVTLLITCFAETRCEICN